MPFIQEVTCEELFNFSNINNIIIEYALTGSNPLVQNIDPCVFIPAVRQAFINKSKTQNIKFNLLVDDGRCFGVGVYELYVNGNCPDLIADVCSIYVSPNYRKQGWGKKMLNALFEQAKGFGAKGMYFSAPFGSKLDRVLKHSDSFKPVYISYFKEL